MRIGLIFGPTGDWNAIMKAAQIADNSNLDAIGFWDHYHSEKPEWAMVCGWSAYGALALTTKRIHLVPMVIDRMNYLPGVLAKETSMLSLISSGRFELGIGAGDYFKEARAWGIPVPDALTRIAQLKETVAVLHQIWRGELVTYQGEHLHLKDAACTPVPPGAPRVVVGAGNSRRLIHSAVEYADEINVYPDEEIIRFARDEMMAAQRSIKLSVFMGSDLPEPEKLAAWEVLGIERVFVTIWPPFDTIQRLIELSSKR